MSKTGQISRKSTPRHERGLSLLSLAIGLTLVTSILVSTIMWYSSMSHKSKVSSVATNVQVLASNIQDAFQFKPDLSDLDNNWVVQNEMLPDRFTMTSMAMAAPDIKHGLGGDVTVYRSNPNEMGIRLDGLEPESCVQLVRQTAPKLDSNLGRLAFPITGDTFTHNGGGAPSPGEVVNLCASTNADDTTTVVFFYRK
ncbi:hypothetical protein [Salipiger mucosus]|uniref:Type 4 secretion system PilS N-terminal domain-containing protein n=1 Tax=Salipiger mucosus DSM 16094 TaxID=1123237 RepID=S9QQ29_9RHOB|nr:hypothetical protein [Salipiger mucosus]EPX83516.1 hypothetical protein Salmuc_02124 [Salipiger mucosus DSM 16094]